MISPYLCTDSHRDTSISLVPVYSAKTRPIGEIGCDDCISHLDIVDLLRSDGPMPIVSQGEDLAPLRDEELRFKKAVVICKRQPTCPAELQNARCSAKRGLPNTKCAKCALCNSAGQKVRIVFQYNSPFQVLWL